MRLPARHRRHQSTADHQTEQENHDPLHGITSLHQAAGGSYQTPLLANSFARRNTLDRTAIAGGAIRSLAWRCVMRCR